MKRSRFTETQIVSILKEADAGAKVKDLCRKHGISDATYYNWKSKYGGMEASDLKRMKELEQELSQFKRMYADLARENDAMRSLIEKSSDAVREARGGSVPERKGRVDCPQLRLCRPIAFELVPRAGRLAPGVRIVVASL